MPPKRGAPTLLEYDRYLLSAPGENMTKKPVGGSPRVPLRLRSHDDGAAAVELALVAPIVLLLMFGLINFAVLFAQKLAVNNAVREGARAAVVGSAQYSTVDVQSKVQTALNGTIAMNPSDVTVTSIGSCADSGVGNDYTVRANYDSSLLMPMLIPGFPGSFNIDGTAVYRCEW